MKKSTQVFSNLLWVGILFSIIFLITYVLNSTLTLKKLDRANSGYVTTQAISFEIAEDIHVTPFEIAQALEPTDYLFQRSGVGFEDLLLFSYGEDVEFDIIEGRQFTAEDLTQSAELKMMGKKSTAQASLGDWMQIATLGVSTPSLLDYGSVTLPCTMNREYLPRGIWVIDGESSLEKSFDNLTQLIGATQLRRIETKEIGQYRANGQNRSLKGFLYVVIFCCILSYLPVTSYWIQSRNQLYQLTYLLGISDGKLTRYILKQLCSLAILGNVSGMATCILCLAPKQPIKWSLLAMVFFLCLFLALSVGFLLFHLHVTQQRRNEAN